MLFETADMVFFFPFIFLSFCCTDDSDDSAMQQLVGPIVPRITRLKQTVSTRGKGRGAMKSGFDGVEWNDGGIIRPKVSRWVQKDRYISYMHDT